MGETTETVSRHSTLGSNAPQYNRLIWVDDNIDESSIECQHTLEQLYTVINPTTVLKDLDACVELLCDVQFTRVFVITSGSMGYKLIPRTHPMQHIDSIYVFCGNSDRHKQWTKEWPKVKGVHTQIEPICDALRQSVKQCNRDSMPMSFVSAGMITSTTKLDQLEPSFMYTQMFKDALLDMEHDRDEVKNLVAYCREPMKGLPSDLKVIDEFDREYHPDQAIWWYTRDCFIYRMLNVALRWFEWDIIIDMGFYLHDLHRQIEQLHHEQVDQYHGEVFTLYRGQGLSTADFDKLKNTLGGLLSFNSFLSTSKCWEFSRFMAESSSHSRETVGILFVMTIDPTLTSTPFADIGELSYFAGEAEVLFSMHSVFRIDEVKPLNEYERLFEVRLTLTADADPQLRLLKEVMANEAEGLTGWKRIAHLLIKVGQLEKAEELYTTLLFEAINVDERAYYHHQLANIKDRQSNYSEALSFYNVAVNIYELNPSENDLHLATLYSNIGLVHDNMGDYSKALSFYEKADDIWRNNQPENDLALGTLYNNMGLVYDNMSEYPKALSFLRKALDIKLKSLPGNHPDLATLYSNIGGVCERMKAFSEALLFYEKDLDISRRVLPSDHLDLGTSYNNTGMAHYNLREYSKALAHLEKSQDIKLRKLSADHPSLALSDNNIGLVYSGLAEYSKALSHLEKACDVYQKTLPADHRDLANSYNNIGEVYFKMGDYLKALSSFERYLDIIGSSLSYNHPDIRGALQSIEMAKKKLLHISSAVRELSTS